MIIIRDLKEEDIAAAVALQSIPWPSESNAKLAKAEMLGGLQETLGLYNSKFVVAVNQDEEIVGMAAWGIAPFAGNTYGLSWAVVHPDYRKQGINTMLLDFRLQKIKEHNKADAYDVITRTWDNPLYRSRGFVAGLTEAMQHPEGKSLLLAHFKK